MNTELHAITRVDKLVDGTRVYWPLYKLWDGTRNTCTCTNRKPSRVSWTTNCMLSLGLTSYEMELGFSDLFTSYEMELETCVHVQIENQLGFHELQIACYNLGWEVMR